jgi:hypothetical protein
MGSMTIVVEESEISGVFTAHYLEIDLVAQGPSREGAVEHLFLSLQAVEEYKPGWETSIDRSPAPEEYWPTPRSCLCGAELTH